MPIIRIDDPADPRLESYRNVPDAELLERRGYFVAEGRFVVARLLASGRFAAESVLVTETARRAMEEVLAGATLPVYVVAPWIINAITGFHIHRGCLALGRRPAPGRWEAVAEGARRLVVLERVANADNVGAIFRNAAGFGADAVLLEPSCTDPLYRKAIRTSMGAALQVPFARMDRWPACLAELRTHGFDVVALTPGAEATIQDLASGRSAVASGFSRKSQIALVLGHEGDGLTAEALDACTHRARIPMASGIDSLNVATACAIALYELQDLPPEGGSHR